MAKRLYNKIVKDNNKLFVVNKEGAKKEASSYINQAYSDVQKLRKSVLQRIERLDKAVGKEHNPLRANYYSRDLGNLKGLTAQQLINRRRDLQYELNLSTSTIRGAKKYSSFRESLDDVLDSEDAKSEFFRTYRKFEELRGDVLLEYGSYEVLNSTIRVVKNELENVDLDELDWDDVLRIEDVKFETINSRNQALESGAKMQFGYFKPTNIVNEWSQRARNKKRGI